MNQRTSSIQLPEELQVIMKRHIRFQWAPNLLLMLVSIVFFSGATLYYFLTKEYQIFPLDSTILYVIMGTWVVSVCLLFSSFFIIPSYKSASRSLIHYVLKDELKRIQDEYNTKKKTFRARQAYVFNNWSLERKKESIQQAVDRYLDSKNSELSDDQSNSIIELHTRKSTLDFSDLPSWLLIHLRIIPFEKEEKEKLEEKINLIKEILDT